MQRNFKRSDPSKRNGEVKRAGGARRAAINVPYQNNAAPDDEPHDDGGPAWDVVRNLINSDSEPSRMLELYYWTREPGIVELIRAYLDLPEATQRSLGDFLLANKAQSIVAAFDEPGRLVLSRSNASARDKRVRSREDAGG